MACSGTLHCAVWSWRCPGALYVAGGATGAPGTYEKAIGTSGSMVIGPSVLGGKLGPITSKGAALPILVWCS